MLNFIKKVLCFLFNAYCIKEVQPYQQVEQQGEKMLKSLRAAAGYKRSGGVGQSYTITASVDDQNMFTLFGSPSTADTFILTINSGVIVGATTTANAALIIGAFPVGSVLDIINNGQIIGAGGKGADGDPSAADSVGLPGSTAAAAIQTTFDLEIDNTNGDIFGGGGGGGSGGGAVGAIGSCGDVQNGGSGGGGGAGDNGGGGSTAYYGGNNGSAGTTVGGSGGAAVIIPNAVSGAGGNGGEYGAVGNAGGASSGACVVNAGGAGGAAGNAIDTGGSTITWLGGNNSAQVKGAVS